MIVLLVLLFGTLNFTSSVRSSEIKNTPTDDLKAGSHLYLAEKNESALKSSQMFYLQEYNIGLKTMRIQLRQEPARLKYVNPKYVCNVSIYTGRKGRGMPYLTNMTYTILLPWLNNVTGSITFKDLKTKNAVTISYKMCDAMNVPWLKNYISSTLVNAPAACPIRAMTYHLVNMGVPDDLPFQLMPNDYEVEAVGFKTRSKEKMFSVTIVLRHERGIK